MDIPKDAWFHLRLEVAGAQARLYVKDMDKPALVMSDLKSGVQKGQVALFDLTGTNELILAVSELGGGWGFVCRLSKLEP